MTCDFVEGLEVAELTSKKSGGGEFVGVSLQRVGDAPEAEARRRLDCPGERGCFAQVFFEDRRRRTAMRRQRDALWLQRERRRRLPPGL